LCTKDNRSIINGNGPIINGNGLGMFRDYGDFQFVLAIYNVWYVYFICQNGVSITKIGSK